MAVSRHLLYNFGLPLLRPPLSRRKGEKNRSPALATYDLQRFPGGLGFGLTLLFLLFRLRLADRAQETLK